MTAGSQPRQVAAASVMNPQQAPAVGMVTSTNQPFATVQDGATEPKRRRMSPSKAQVLMHSFSIHKFKQKMSWHFCLSCCSGNKHMDIMHCPIFHACLFIWHRTPFT